MDVEVADGVVDELLGLVVLVFVFVRGKGVLAVAGSSSRSILTVCVVL